MKPHKRRKKKNYLDVRMPMRIIAVGIVVFMAIGGSIYFTKLTGSIKYEAAKTNEVSLRIGGSLGAKYAGEIVAAGAAIFKHNGIDLDVRETGSADSIVSVESGAATFGVTDSISFLIARSKGQPVVAFAAGFLEDATVFYALEKAGIRTPQDFIGKRVGRREGAHSAIIYDALLKNIGVSRSQIVESSTETDLDALLNNRVDVIPGHIGQEGFLLHQKGVPYTVIRVSDYGIHVPDTVYFTTEKVVLDRPSVVQRVLQAIIAGWTMVYTDTAKSIPLIVATRKGLTPAQVQFELAAQRDFVMPLSRRITEFDEQQWKQLRAILMGARLMDGSVDLASAVNYDILKEAYRKPISFGN